MSSRGQARCGGDCSTASPCSATCESSALGPKASDGSYVLVDPSGLLSDSVIGVDSPAPRVTKSPTCTGRLLCTDTPLSFWGGVDPLTGEIIDRHHPLSGQRVDGCILSLPGGRGSCSGSLALLELLLAGVSPEAIILERPDDILALGSIVAEVLFGKGLPILVIDPRQRAKLANGGQACVDLSKPSLEVRTPAAGRAALIQHIRLDQRRKTRDLRMETVDHDLLAGTHGAAAQQAMSIVLHMAALWDAPSLIPISSSHIDCCLYTGPASVLFAQHFAALGGTFRVPAMLNAISVDLERWRDMHVPETLGEPSAAIARAYMSMGADPTSLTCAPYLLGSSQVPRAGDDVGWAESNAVVYANSVLGVRTQKYPDLLDVCIALTGRAPAAGAHLETNRAPVMSFVLDPALTAAASREASTLVWPLLGYRLGSLAGSRIPIVFGLEDASPRPSDLKAFCAAFATTSSAPMVHIAGVTPEAARYSTHLLRQAATAIGLAALRADWHRLNPAFAGSVGLVALGNPHFSLDEFQQLSAELQLPAYTGQTLRIPLYITCGRHVLGQATAAGHVDIIQASGTKIITDTCWCMITEPVIPHGVQCIMTHSAKYAHYGAGLSGCTMRLGDLKDCVAVAFGRADRASLPAWLDEA